MAKRKANKKNFFHISLTDKEAGIVFGGNTGVTKKEARRAFEKGFVENARKKRKTKYKGYTGIEFGWY